MVRVYGTFEDVTEARLISTRLKEHTETLENILNNLNDAVITINSEGQIRQCNEVAVRLFGYDKSEPIGANVAMLMPQPYAMKHDSYMQHYKATGEAKIIGVGRQLPARRKNGDVFQMELSLTESVEKGEKQYIGLVRDISDRQYNQLRSIQANYLRRETLVDANDAICNAIARLPIFKHYQIQENLLHASADGQKFESRLETFKTRYASKYFGTNKGVSAVTLVANHAAINAKMIGANEHESHFIYDLLFSNTSDIKPDVLSTDTHGANHMNFALLDLSGYAFAPRYANVGSVIDDQFSIHNEQLVMKTPIDIATVESQWDVAQRIMISLQRKTTTQAVLVRKLSGYPKDHPLLKAITEYNRLVKALYILNYMGDEKLRKHVQRALNRGEAYHQLRRAIASVNGNRFRGSTDYEIELWNDCARLLTNAIIYFNSLVLSKLLVHFEHTGQIDMLTLTQQVSPVAWTNINLNGTYSFNFGQDILDMDELIRPITEEEVLIEN
ncbi:Tn3 family transposase [Alteromonas sp. RW2A1]|uniref:Tn3 family transposase n=1 Tax=Alteromonas sp. RW2A1 TaxID=1917158 RepID=UPI0022B443D0|nr:Tn3 family transposase [Alteromonas sp. RW2A1]